MRSRPVQEVIHADAYMVVDARTPVRKVVREMAERRLSAALVTEHGVLTGIFTERDATWRVLSPGLDADTLPVAEVMTHNPRTIAPDHPFGHALHLMYEGGFRHVPVVDRNRRPVGIVSAADALGIEAVELGKELERREEITVIL